MRSQLIKDGIALVLLVSLCIFSWNVNAHDETGNLSGIYYDNTREGEGIFVVHDQTFNVLSWAFFTHNPEYTEEGCVYTDAVTGEFGEILAPGEQHCFEFHGGGEGQWYIAADPWHGSSSGVVYDCSAYDYPIVINRKLCESRTVGLYIMDWIPDVGGFRLIITPTGGDAPDTLYNWYYFDTALLKAR